MTTAPSPDTPRPKWMNGIHWDTTPPFRVEWLSKTPVGFFRIGHLKNSLNENYPVLVGKDGQEIEEECGRALMHEMQFFADMNTRGRSMSPERREGYARAASRGRQGFIKREEDRDRW
jgi:YTH domain-containing protein 1